MDDMMEELIDRFGDIPKKVQQLLHIAALKGLAHSAYVTAVGAEGGRNLSSPCMRRRRSIPGRSLPSCSHTGTALCLRREEPPYFLYRKTGRSGKEKGEVILALLRKILEDIRSLHT